MPAPVPAGYTRGPILFISACRNPHSQEQLLQRLWEEAGAYGSRIVLIEVGPEDNTTMRQVADLFAGWESESVDSVLVNSRQEALRPSNLARIESATAILLLGENPLRFAATVGGTPLAQAIRRANARGKAVGGFGRSATLLCEHMIAYDARDFEEPAPFLRRHLIQLAPGLGITNRIVLDAGASEPVDDWNRLARLLHAVAYNPFLVGVGLEVDTGVVIYSDNTLAVFGRNSALVVDGTELNYTDVHEFAQNTPLSLAGAKVHALGPNHVFSLNDRVPQPPPESDIPETAIPAQAEE